MSSINLQCERKSSPALTEKEENKINWEDSTQRKKSVEERRAATEVEPRHSTGGMKLWLKVDQWQLQKTCYVFISVLSMHSWGAKTLFFLLLRFFSLVTESITIPWFQTLWNLTQDNRGMVIPEHEMRENGTIIINFFRVEKLDNEFSKIIPSFFQHEWDYLSNP